MTVKVTFFMDADDPDHGIGLSEESFNEVSRHVSAVGGYDIEFEKHDDEIREYEPKPKKAPK